DPEGTQPAGVRRGEDFRAVQGQPLGDVIAGARCGELDDVSGIDAVQFPECSCRAMRDGCLRAGPERGRHQLLLPRRRDAPHPVDTRVHPLPLAGVESALDGTPTNARLDGLWTAEDYELSSCQSPQAGFFGW